MSVIAELEGEFAYNQQLARMSADQARRELAPVAGSAVLDLDPDFRRNVPRDGAGNYLPCCAKCQRKVDASKARKAWVNWETHKVSTDRDAVSGDTAESNVTEEWIGPDCWNAIGLPNDEICEPLDSVSGSLVTCLDSEDEMVVLHQDGRWKATLYASCPEQAHDFVKAHGQLRLGTVDEWEALLRTFRETWQSKYEDD